MAAEAKEHGGRAVGAVTADASLFLVAGLIRIWGAQVRTYIDRYFNILTVAVVVLLALGFVALKYLR